MSLKQIHGVALTLTLALLSVVSVLLYRATRREETSAYLFFTLLAAVAAAGGAVINAVFDVKNWNGLRDAGRFQWFLTAVALAAVVWQLRKMLSPNF